jgi:hypothetical protein
MNRLRWIKTGDFLDWDVFLFAALAFRIQFFQDMREERKFGRRTKETSPIMKASPDAYLSSLR